MLEQHVWSLKQTAHTSLLPWLGHSAVLWNRRYMIDFQCNCSYWISNSNHRPTHLCSAELSVPFHVRTSLLSTPDQITRDLPGPRTCNARLSSSEYPHPCCKNPLTIERFRYVQFDFLVDISSIASLPLSHPHCLAPSIYRQRSAQETQIVE